MRQHGWVRVGWVGMALLLLICASPAWAKGRGPKSMSVSFDPSCAKEPWAAVARLAMEEALGEFGYAISSERAVHSVYLFGVLKKNSEQVQLQLDAQVQDTERGKLVASSTVVGPVANPDEAGEKEAVQRTVQALVQDLLSKLSAAEQGSLSGRKVYLQLSWAPGWNEMPKLESALQPWLERHAAQAKPPLASQLGFVLLTKTSEKELTQTLEDALGVLDQTAVNWVLKSPQVLILTLSPKP